MIMKLLDPIGFIVLAGVVSAGLGCSSGSETSPPYGDIATSANAGATSATTASGATSTTLGMSSSSTGPANSTGAAAVTNTATSSGGVVNSGGFASTGTATTGSGTSGSGTSGFGTNGFGTNGFGASGAGGSTSNATSATGGATICNPTLTGEQFYMQADACVFCHGADALGIEGRGPEVRFPKDDYARWIIRNGRMDHPDYTAGMEAYSSDCLTDAMLEEILAFLKSFPKPTDGAGLYAEFCANCHGADGRGGVTTRDLNGELHEIPTLTAEGHNPMSYDERIEYMPVMTDQLSQAEIQLISDYLQNELGLAF